MIILPKLSSQATTLYPLRRQDCYQTEVLTFIDGSDQRFAVTSGSLTKLEMDYSMLSEAEAIQLQRAVQLSLSTGEPISIEGITWGPDPLLVHPSASEIRLRYEGEGLVSLAVQFEEA